MTPVAPTSPTTATWYFDVISPFAYLALGEIEELAKSVAVVRELAAALEAARSP
jgi:2-hydroxychromene-2-carboxylate isomerase